MSLRVDRFSSIKQRLRQGADNFDFGALIEGVSTLETLEPPVKDRAAAYVSGFPAVLERPAIPDAPDEAIEELEESELFESQTALQLRELEFPAIAPRTTATSEGRLTDALRDMISRLNSEIAQFATLLRVSAVEPAGACLANINRTLELLHSIDPQGDNARRFNDPGAPPPGRTWPSPTWSVVEFSESPLSGLLPPEANEELVRGLLYAAWGVTFE